MNEALELISPNALSWRRCPSVTAHSAGFAVSLSPAITAGLRPRMPWSSSCSSESGPPLTSTVLLTGSAATGEDGRWAALAAWKISTAGYFGR